MGLQDRDYYWERHRQQKPKPESPIKYLWLPVLVIVGLALFAGKELIDKPLSVQDAQQQRAPINRQIPGGLVLHKDRQGHFRGTVRINGVPMPFMIDTGATRTVIPSSLAKKARLPFGQRTTSNTAGGKVISRSTTITRLTIGNATLNNIPAKINYHLDEVLIGMNTLKFFRMTQEGNSLELRMNGYRGQLASSNPEPRTARPTYSTDYNPPQRTRIVKRVKCSTVNGKEFCSTSFGDR